MKRTAHSAAILFAVLAAMAALNACGQVRLPGGHVLKCSVEPKPGQATEPHDTPASTPLFLE